MTGSKLIDDSFFKVLPHQAGLDALELEENNNTDGSLFIALRSNLAMTLLKLEEFQGAADECTRILETDPNNTKGM
jgi:hypothetical protein